MRTRLNHRRGLSQFKFSLLALVGLLGFGTGYIVRSVLPIGGSPHETSDDRVMPSKETSSETRMTSSKDAVANARTPNNSTLTAVEGGRSPIIFDPPEMNLGFVQPNTEIVGTVLIRNPTDQPLRILDSRASCTCTSISLANTVIPAGGSVPLTATLKTGGQLGPKNAAVRVLIDGFDIAQVDVKSLVTLPVQAEPAYLLANRMREGSRNPQQASSSDFEDVTSGEITVRSLDGQHFRLISCNRKPPKYVGFDPQRDPIRNEYTVTWDLNEYDPVTCQNELGEHMPAWWVIETDHPSCPIFDVQVRHRCTVTSPLRPGQTWLISERRMLLGAVVPGKSIDMEVVIARHPRATGQMERIVAATTTTNEFSVALVEQSPWRDGESTCILRITPSETHRGLIYADVILTSSSGTSMPLTVIGKISG